MKKSSISTPLKSIWGIYLLLFASTFQSLQAQGFYTPTNHAQGAWNTRIEVLPGGYTAKATFGIGMVESVFGFGTLQLDAAGTEIAWDSFIMAGGISGPYYDWLPDNDILEYGSNFGGPVWTVNKLKQDFTPVWSLSFTSSLAFQDILGIVQNDSGAIFLLGKEYNTIQGDSFKNITLRKIDGAGNLLWAIIQPAPDSGGASYSFNKTMDGGCLFNVVSEEANQTLSTLHRISPTGQVVWSTPLSFYSFNMIENSQGDIYNYGLRVNLALQQYWLVLAKHSAQGQLLWEKTISQVTETGHNLFLANNDDVLITGFKSVNGQNKNFFARYNPDGTKLWEKNVSLLTDDWDGYLSGAIATPDNGFVIAGTVPNIWNLFLLKLDANGNVYPGQISGIIAKDSNLDCLVDTTEQALAYLKVALKSTSIALYASADSNGQYEILDIPGGDYLLSAVMPSNLWESCDTDIPIAIPDTGTISIVQDLPVQVLEDCPFMTLDIATPFLRRCFQNTYTVNYCNQGTIAADSAYVQIILDPLLIFNAASIPYTQNGDTLFFSLGAVPSLECGNFTVTVTVDCDSTVLGETICVSASIFPDTICNPPSNWTGALLKGSGECIGDSVRFLLRNIGTAPSTGGISSYVVDEHVIMFQQPIPSLAPNEIFQIMVEANGNTKRFIADQEPNTPGLEKPSIGVEGCGPNGATNWGFMLQFLNKDGNPFTDTDCRQVVGAYDPNDKQAFPIGVKSAHLIEANTPLEYMIRFQNTGTDTAFTVVVKDTLSSWLDPATVRPGAASHSYTWSLSGEGILTFTFEHILLPDSNINEAASHGFIQFNIEQQKDLLPGVVIENRAGIYFDFNAPIITNTVFHTIGQAFLISSTNTPEPKQNLLEIWPNPAEDVVTIRLEKHYKPGQRLVLRNTLGNVLREMPVQGQITELPRTGLPAGLYFVEILDGKGVLAIGKVMWQ